MFLMQKEAQTIRLFGTAPDSIVDGPGLRYSVFTQGCAHNCPGCHNQDSQPFDGGVLTSVDVVMAEIESNKLIQGVTLSGGEPFDQPAPCAEIARRCKAAHLSVWAYSGYLYEDLMEKAKTDPDIESLLATIDVLVDGPFVQSMHSYELKWRGSRNQRLIDMGKTRSQGKVVLWEPYSFVPQKPSNW